VIFKYQGHDPQLRPLPAECGCAGPDGRAPEPLPCGPRALEAATPFGGNIAALESLYGHEGLVPFAIAGRTLSLALGGCSAEGIRGLSSAAGITGGGWSTAVRDPSD